MSSDIRALCAELTDELHGYASANPHPDSDELVIRARAALAEPAPEGPTNRDIEALHQAVFASRLHGPPPNTSCEVDLVRAALARWGQTHHG